MPRRLAASLVLLLALAGCGDTEPTPPAELEPEVPAATAPAATPFLTPPPEPTP